MPGTSDDARAFARLVAETLRRLGYDVRTEVQARASDNRVVEPDAVVVTPGGLVLLETKATADADAITQAASQVALYQRTMPGLVGAFVVVPDSVKPSGDDRIVRLADLGSKLQTEVPNTATPRLSGLPAFVPRSVKVGIHLPFVSVSTEFELTPTTATLIVNFALIATAGAAIGALLQLVGLLNQLVLPLAIISLIAAVIGTISALIVLNDPSSRLTSRILGVVRGFARNVAIYLLAPFVAVVAGGLVVAYVTGAWKP